MTKPLRFGVFRGDERDPHARFCSWYDALTWAATCADDDSENEYTVKQLVDVPPPGLGSVWVRCDREGDIQ